MRYQVLMTDKAERDLEEIVGYIAETESPARADRVLDVLLDVIDSLENLPERGSHPRELLAVGYKKYRQVLSNPWRIFYRVVERRVYIAVIADGRRDMRSLLTQRLLDA